MWPMYHFHIIFASKGSWSASL